MQLQAKQLRDCVPRRENIISKRMVLIELVFYTKKITQLESATTLYRETSIYSVYIYMTTDTYAVLAVTLCSTEDPHFLEKHTCRGLRIRFTEVNRFRCKLFMQKHNNNKIY